MILLQPTHSDSMCFIFLLFATDFLANQIRSRSRSRRTLVLKLAPPTGCGDCYLTLPLRSTKITIEYRSNFRAGRHDTLPLLD